MIVTLTELGPRKYGADIEGRAGKRETLTPELHQLIQASGRLVWKTPRFGLGCIGQQAQYSIDIPGGDNGHSDQ